MRVALTRGSLRGAALLCHGALLVALLIWCAQLDAGIARRAAAALLATPLLLLWRGLLNDEARSQRWLALALVVYIGGGIVEVVAMQGEAIAAAVILLAALLELSLLWLLLRARGRPAPRG